MLEEDESGGASDFFRSARHIYTGYVYCVETLCPYKRLVAKTPLANPDLGTLGRLSKIRGHEIFFDNTGTIECAKLESLFCLL